ncbi:Targeting protein for Xklp2 [Salmo salar]|uniref:Targeting protein for Xklp2 n=1 Tax=Salmo salar TaxID=8030 RepID=B5X2W1_SALSA|nr:Targeting protein for Xklp2 [Salmo salar]ACI33642.1 Targeting protein for Xklp2 [Salmo salar]|eukprot:NP_001133651.1 Targeting protein for Xklp2 [Salmo salar]
MDAEMAQGESASHYEFDAPSHVIDFQALDTEDNADIWFDQCAGQDERLFGHLATPNRNNIPFGATPKAHLPRAIVSPRVKENSDSEAPSTSSVPTRPDAPSTSSNIVTSWGNRPAPVAAPPKKGPSARPRRVSKRKDAASNEEGLHTAPEATPPAKKLRRSLSLPPRRSGSVQLNLRAANQARPAAAAASTTQHKSSEQQEMVHIKTLQKEVADKLKRNEASYRAALAGSQLPKKLALATTVPKEFNFSTDGRVKAGTASTHREVDFTAQLRKHPSSPTKVPKGATVPKPFNLSTGSKRKVADPVPFMPMAQQIELFQKRTPTRYHLRSRQSQERGPSPVKSEQLKITHPHTPQLMTRQRSRPTVVKSSAELEAEELQKLQQFKFKALELNRKILEGALNPKKPTVKESTHPEVFHMHMDRRLAERQASKKPDEPEEQHTFHSRPLPVRILEEVVGVPEKKVQCPTVPESPAWALKRMRMDRKVEEVKPPAPLKAHAVPHFGLPFLPKLQDKTQVEVCPFSFEERERERQVLKEKRLEELRHEEVPTFKAQPLPDFHAVVLPEKKVAEPTKPEPFKLLLDERGAAKNDRWEQMMKEEQKHQAEAATFKARPNTAIHKEPFMPKKENRSVLVPEVFQLSTERRAKERLEFERAVSEKEALRARVEEAQRMELEECEKEKMARLRQEQVHKAQPIRRYKQLELKKSDVTLTVPQSPNFSDRFRM